MTVPAENVRELLAPPRGCGCPEKVLLCCWCGLWSVQREKVTGYHIRTTTSYTYYHKLILHFHSTHTHTPFLPSLHTHQLTLSIFLMTSLATTPSSPCSRVTAVSASTSALRLPKPSDTPILMKLFKTYTYRVY